MSETPHVRVAIVGVSGYTGAELLRLLHDHPYAEVTKLCAHSTAGRSVAEVLPSFRGLIDGTIDAFDASAVAEVADVAFTALPHGASAGAVRALRDKGVIVFDLSADFRLKDLDTYTEWYGDHQAPGLFGAGVYGLVELSRDKLRAADLVAVPGCYPTATVAALAPLLKEGLVDPNSLIVDAKSGVSGAGRKASLHTHLPEAAGGIRAYKAGGMHRHTPEIVQALSSFAREPLRLTFTPHLVPMTRGILVTAYADLASSEVDAQRCHAAAEAFYEGSPSIHVLPAGTHPDTLWVKGSNRLHLAYAVDARARRVVAQASIDNLLKGAAGQAVQAFNVRFGYPEGTSLMSPGAWP